MYVVYLVASDRFRNSFFLLQFYLQSCLLNVNDGHVWTFLCNSQMLTQMYMLTIVQSLNFWYTFLHKLNNQPCCFCLLCTYVWWTVESQTLTWARHSVSVRESVTSWIMHCWRYFTIWRNCCEIRINARIYALFPNNSFLEPKKLIFSLMKWIIYWFSFVYFRYFSFMPEMISGIATYIYLDISYRIK